MDSKQLKKGLTVYFADNVLVMLMATTAGTLGATLFTSGSLSPAATQVLGITFNVCVAIALYCVAASRYHAASEPEGAALLGNKKDAESCVETELQRIEYDASSGYSHIISMLPWIIIVPMVNIPVSLSDKFHNMFVANEYSGCLFASHFFMFMGFLMLELILGRIYMNRPDAGSKCEGMLTFLLNSINHSALSSAGKSLHLLECVTCTALIGYRTTPTAQLSETLLLLIITWFLLAECWPSLKDDTTDNKRFKNIIMTITVYSWAFSFINTVWGFFYSYGVFGEIIYWAIMGVCLLVALLLAYLSGNFYGGPSSQSIAFGLTLCWVIDFGVWWAWAQIMTDIDAKVAPTGGFLPLLAVNGAILLGLILATGLIYICADLQTMADQSAQRQRNRSHLQAKESEAAK